MNFDLAKYASDCHVNDPVSFVRQAEKLRQLLAEGKIAYSLCGHVHSPSEEDREVIAGSVTRYGVMTDLRCENGAVQIGRIRL